ncbi:MAG: 50S ribosomal protein L23 [Nanoarchaeota archaeon]
MNNILKYPLSTEKAVRLMESENELLFVVDRKANKIEIKKHFEKLFKVKVLKVNTFIDGKGRKRAYIKLAREYPAIDIMTQLGIM